ncbi:MAG: hypothetical protein GY715_15645 [Planctomycetes bacterium]|nr:hypothetical protein [Planctomycetota bacterium]
MALGGVETEYGPACFGEKRLSPGDVAARVLARAIEVLPHMRDRCGGIFLGSGGRLLIDGGAHLEYCTPETLSPAGQVVAIRAGEAIVEDLVRTVPGGVLARTNHCYLSGATYGSHENHCLERQIGLMYRYLTPHLVSRIIYTGAGGLDPTHRGIRYVISPRATHYDAGNGRRCRSIANKREEPHAEGYHRLHITCGDTLALDRPLYLRLGTTALLAALVDADLLSLAEVPVLASAPEAIGLINRDPSLRQRVRLRGGDSVTALEIQERLLEMAERGVDRSPGTVPAWSGAMLAEWRRMLDTLARRPEEAVVDWAVKRRVFDDQVRRAGFTAEEIEEANHRTGRRTKTDMAMEALLETIPGETPPSGATDPRVARMRSLRQRLCRIDFFFTVLPGGLIDELRDGLDDDVPGVDAETIRRAMRQPPEPTRALLRSRYVRRHARSSVRYWATWDMIGDRRENRILPMRDPYSLKTRWESAPPEPDRRSVFTLPTLSHAYNRGDYRMLKRLLRELFSGDDGDTAMEHSFLTYQAWAESRTGNLAAAERAAARYRETSSDGEIPGLYAAIYRFRGLWPSPRIWRWIRRGDRIPTSAWTDSGYVCFLGHKGVALKCAGRIDEAIDVLRRSVEVALVPPNHQRIHARNQCDLADCLRIAGHPRSARLHLATAGRILQQHGYSGEFADHYLMTRAKLTTHPRAALTLLARARRILERNGNPVGVARTQVLRARIARDRRVIEHARQAILAQRARVPDLATCPKLTSILRRWDKWTLRPTDERGPDRFWFV